MPSNDTLVVVNKAIAAFKEYWESNAEIEEVTALNSYGDEDMRGLNTASEMLLNYVEDRKAMLSGKDFKLNAIEQPFAVPLDGSGTVLYVGRLDKVFTYQGKKYVAEHKTSSLYKKDGPFRLEFMESFSPNSQVDGYLYSGHLLYGDDLKAVWIDASLVHKTIHDGFRIIPIERKHQQLGAWLWETHYYIEQIKANLEALKNAKSSEDYLGAFPKNTSNCTGFGTTCPYIDLCKMQSNPEQFTSIPAGFVEHKWEPFNELELGNNKVNVLGGKGTVTKKHMLFDNTRIQDSRKCLRFYYFRHIRHFATSTERRPLLFGGAWHAAMDVVWKELCSTK